MSRIYIIFILFNTLLVYSQEKKICISVDDLPSVTYRDNRTEVDLLITNKLIKAFKENGVPAIGYVNESKLYKKGTLNTHKVDLLKLWLQNGLDLGNHTFSHFDYNEVPDSIFFNNIIKGEKIIKPLLKDYGKTLKYFRHPYLHIGSDSIKSIKLHSFLTKNNYLTSPVTIDNDDYLFAKPYHIAFKNEDVTLMQEIGDTYVSYLEQKLLYYESKSIEVFNKNITQTLIIHANLLNANYMDSIAMMFKKHGYSFVSQEEALKSPEYSSKINSYTKRGVSWIFRWGMSRGMDETIMNDDIKVPNKIRKLLK